MLLITALRDLNTPLSRHLVAERVELLFPWSISPFVDPSDPANDGEEESVEESPDEKDSGPESSSQGELKVKTASEVPWIDLV